MMTEVPPLLWTRSLVRQMPYMHSHDAWKYIDDANTHYALHELIDRKAPGRSPKLNDAQRQALAEMVEQGKQAGSINSEMTTTWIVTMIDCLIYGCAWLVRSGECDAQTAAESAVQTLFGGIGV